MKKYGKEMWKLGMVIPNAIYCVAILTCSNLDETAKMNIESVVKKNSGVEQSDPTILEHTMRRLKAK